jgi:preprotein translocase subunit SecF
MSVINEALRKAAQARRAEEPSKVLFEAPAPAEEPVVTGKEPKLAPAFSSNLSFIFLAVAVLLLAGYSVFLYQSQLTEKGLRVAAETRYTEQSATLDQKNLELERAKADLESLSVENAVLQKTVAAQEEAIAANVSGQAKLTDKLRTLFKALFASRNQVRQFKNESQSKEKTIGLLVGELSEVKGLSAPTQN